MTLFILKNGERTGPYTIDQVVASIRKGELLMSDLAWREGKTDWEPIHKIQDIVSAALPPMPVTLKEQNPQTSPSPLPQILPPKTPSSGESSGLGPSDKLRLPTLLLCFFLGCFGLHAFYAGRRKEAVILIALLLAGFLLSYVGALTNDDTFFTLGGLGYILVGCLCLGTTFRIALGKYKDGLGRSITKWV